MKHCSWKGTCYTPQLCRIYFCYRSFSESLSLLVKVLMWQCERPGLIVRSYRRQETRLFCLIVSALLFIKKKKWTSYFKIKQKPLKEISSDLDWTERAEDILSKEKTGLRWYLRGSWQPLESLVKMRVTDMRWRYCEAVIDMLLSLSTDIPVQSAQMGLVCTPCEKESTDHSTTTNSLGTTRPTTSEQKQKTHYSMFDKN